MSVSIEGSGSITGVSTFYNATFSGITTFADNIDFDGNIAGVTTFLGVGVTSLNVLGVSTFTGQLNAGTISATTLSATTVSIAGTLTYQDVTNIDSVGVVTARSGIHVTGGSVGIGTDTIDGNSQLHIKNTSGNAKITLETNETYDSYINFSGATSEASIGYEPTSNAVVISNAADGLTSAERFRITSDGLVGVSSATPKTDLDASTKTGAVALPQGTTAQRPTGSAPYIRKNTTNNALEYYDGTSWVEIITDYFPTGSVILG